MKKVLISAAGSLSFLTLASQVHAANYCPSIFGAICTPSTDAQGSFNNTITTLLNLAFVLATIVALIFLIWGGFKWIISQGDKAAVEGARLHIINALIGLVIIFLSYVILNLVLGIFGLSFSNIVLPKLTF